MLAFAPLDAAINFTAPAVAALADAVQPIAGSGATALAIVGFTIGVRLLISPLSCLRARSQHRRVRLAPQLAELQRRHRDDPARLAAELSALGAGPFAGCLPSLLQAPFFLLLYGLFSTASVGGRPNPLLHGELFGLSLGHQLTAGAAGPALPLFAALLLIGTLLAWWSSRRIRAATAAPPAAPAPSAAAAPLAGDPAALVRRLLPLLPYAAVPILAIAPLAAGLYLVTTTAFTLLEQVVLGPRPGAAQHVT